VLRFEHTALQLDALEAVEGDHAARLRDDLLRIQAFAPGVGLVGPAVVLGVLEEQVGAVSHLRPHGAAQQVDHRRAGHLSLQVQHRDLVGTDRLGGVLGTVGAGRQRELHGARLRPDRRVQALLHGVQSEG
jgi:hypothetical protein